MAGEYQNLIIRTNEVTPNEGMMILRIKFVSSTDGDANLFPFKNASY